MQAMFDDRGLRFQYPLGWELQAEFGDGGGNITLNAPDGVAFALLTLDDSRPLPEEEAARALGTMLEEYPGLEYRPWRGLIDGHAGYGFDAEFFSLDFVSYCALRAFRTERRSIVFFVQWSDLEAEEATGILQTVIRSIEETDNLLVPGEEEDSE